jgi:threonine dehydratase
VRVAPFDDAAVVAGQGTVALELFADVDDLDAVLVPSAGAASSPGWPWWRPRWRRPSS